ncbi:branched-chain amino acid ABC transporter permease [Candidatus Cryosericum hinesii]|jgi:branched-chain amino acid transport system permease protein|uniref:Branched-chain amino acid ABC transporter permease n=2 Tax=Candidatus Cryosericum hinesii TaxID=2290915 RepID=A0A398DA44_9BACT|nr:branched-chain amino acid ABC transporter permease [Candidatus Cryosericum hinesii]RIE12272.1 branched-chain amino acid ABC transporter permease [Candidatus Cryosericum hinesii]RIE12406.1 branched-chain amino acid ABC transporter permease [Candidatus Cryosericum hinesii]
MGQFLQQLINGIQIGSIYALIALGYTMVYGIVRLINFAHADIFMFGAYMGFFLAPVMAKIFGGAFIPTIIAAMLITGLLGFIMEKLAYRPLRYKSRLSALITALGVSIFLENFCAMPFVFGPTYRAFPSMIVARNITIPGNLGLVISNVLLLDVGVSVSLMVLLFWFVNKTLMGKQMRAVSFDKPTASLMGINIDVVISTAFIVGPALAGAGGILYGTTYGMLASPFLGIWPGMKAFIAAVLGGIGNIPGAVLGAYVMGISEAFATSVNSNLGYGIAFVILIAILLIRPSGLLGKFVPEKV